MLHCKIAVAYSCWEFPLAGGPDSYRDAQAEGGRGNVIDLRKRVSPEGVALL
jgi:hypothetical protein